MPTIRSVAALATYRQSLQKCTDEAKLKDKILVCTGGGCLASGALRIKEQFTESLAKHGLEHKYSVVGTGCLGPCSKGPVVILAGSRTYYQGLADGDAAEIVEQHLKGNKLVERLIYRNDTDNQPLPLTSDIGFFNKQTKIVLRNCGSIDPLSIDDYIGNKGYAAFAKVLSQMTTQEVIEEVRQSGLRGRGGAGFPTYLKWKMAQQSTGDQKYILCNADEGDPGAYMDRSILEGDPHSILEGMAIGAYAIGASKGYVYVRAEYPLAVERLGHAIQMARTTGF